MKPPAHWESDDFWLGLAKGGGLFVALIGALVLFGWKLDSVLLKSILPHWVAMKANTAGGLVLAGLALWLKAAPAIRSRRGVRIVRRLLAGLVVLLGALSLSEYLAGVDWGIDQWLFQESSVAVGPLVPGRMAAATALGFMLLGSALLLQGATERSARAVSLLAALGALPALAAALIYLYDIDNAYGLGRYLSLAAHTALAFMALAAGILCAQPEHGVVALLRRHDSGGALARRLLPAVLLLPPLIGLLKLLGIRSGLIEADLGVALVALTYVVLLGALVLRSARFLSRSDAEREWMTASVAVSEARLRTLVATIPDMIWLKDMDGVYLACNPAFERFFGAKEADIVGKTDYDFVPRELADFFRANDRAAIAAGRPSRNEEWLTIADTGQRILAETTKTPMLGQQGELLGVLGIARDITRRHEAEAAIHAAQAETRRLLAESDLSRRALLSALEDSQEAANALKRSEDSLRDRNAFVETLLENAPIGFAVNAMDDGRFTYVSRRFSEIYGVPPGALEAVGDFFDKVYPDPAQRERIRARVLADIESGDPARMRWEDVEFTASGGGQKVISAANIPLPEQNQMISMVWDVTDRHRAEAAVRESNTLLRAFIMHSPIYAFIKSVAPNESRTVMASENYGDMIGIPGSQMTGKTMAELFPPDFAAKITADDWAVVSGGEVLRLDEELNGRSYTTVKFPILVEGKNYLAGYTIDITERKQMMDELERHRAQLEERVAERTKELQAANRELEAFSYSVSHDLRAPLRAIAGFVELLRKHNYDAIDDKGRHYMDVIAGAAVQMGRLIDDILTFSRIGRAEMVWTPVDMNRLLDEVRNTLHPQAEGRRIAWKVALLPEARGERAMLALVWQNLLANALKFTQTRENAEIEVGTVAGGAGETVYYVRDNGVGFDMRHLDKLFGLFQRLHPQDQFEGTGVGLANVQRIVQRHGGRVWAEGRVNEGATFYFALPGRKEEG